MRTAFAAVLLVVTSPPLPAQSAGAGSTELPAILPATREVALARSAAPPTVSGDATVLVLRRGVGYEVAEEGSNGVTCFVDRTWRESIEPWCMDEEASRTILPIRLRFAELREQGLTKGEIDRDLADGIREGRFPIPLRPAMTYMMSAEQNLYDDNGAHVGTWRPHLMVYIPYVTDTALGLKGFEAADTAFVVDAGTPLAHVIVVVPAFTDGG